MKNDLREKIRKLRIQWGDYQKDDGTWGYGIANPEVIVDLFIQEYLALLDEVMGKVIGEDDNGEIGDTYAFAARERNDLRAEQRQALQAIRDSVSGSMGK